MHCIRATNGQLSWASFLSPTYQPAFIMDTTQEAIMASELFCKEVKRRAV